MSHDDIDAAVERAMRRETETEPRDEPLPRAECVVCGAPLDEAENRNTNQFCDNHDEKTLAEMEQVYEDHIREDARQARAAELEEYENEQR